MPASNRTMKILPITFAHRISRIKITLATLAMCLLLSNTGFIQAPEATAAESSKTVQKFAVLDFNKVLEESNAFADATKQLQQKKKELGKEARDKQESLRNKRKDLDKTKGAMNEAAFKEKSDALNNEFATFQKKAMAQNEMLGALYEDAAEKISAEIIKLIKKKAQSEKFTMVIEKSIIQYVDEKLDLTAEIFAELNKTMPSSPINFSEYDKITKGDTANAKK